MEKKKARGGWQSTTDGRGSGKQMSVLWSRGASQGQGPGLHTRLTPHRIKPGMLGVMNVPIFQSRRLSLWKSQRVSETMNKTQHSGVQVRTFSLKSNRQTLKHALCVWSRGVCAIRVPVCGVHACVCPQVLVGVYECECVV